MTENNEIPPPPPPPSDGGSATTNPVPYATPGGTGYPGPYIGPSPDKDARTWGMLSHLAALVQVLGIPSILGPLVVWLIKKNEYPFVDDQGKEAVNFNLTVLIAALILTPTICLAGIGILLLIALGITALILAIIGAMKANEGVAYRYPWTLRLIK